MLFIAPLSLFASAQCMDTANQDIFAGKMLATLACD